MGVVDEAAVTAAAMMAPLPMVQVHELAVSSLWPRRYRAVIGYLLGYLVTWTLAGALMMTGLNLVQSWVGGLPLVAVCGAASVVVAMTEDDRRRLRRCGVARPLALTGWPADRDCVEDGFRMAGRCVAITWAMMLTVMAQGGLFATAAGMAYLVAERRGLIADRRLARWSLVVAMVAVLISAGPSVGRIPMESASSPTAATEGSVRQTELLA